MTAPKPISWAFSPGIVKNESSLAAPNRYVDGQWVRFINGRPEKIAGFVAKSRNVFNGVPRSIQVWTDLSGRELISVGTEREIVVLDQDGTPINITPVRRAVTIKNPFATLKGISRLVVNDPGHGATIGDYIIILGASQIGSITPSGRYQIDRILTDGAYSFQVNRPFMAPLVGGGTVEIVYELNPGSADPVNLNGFGAGAFGRNVFGGPVPNYRVAQPRIWNMDNFGTILLASPLGGSLYQWNAEIQTGAMAPVATAPASMLNFFVTGERFVMALGVNGNPMQVAWPDQNTIDGWAVVEGGTANVRTLQGGEYLVAGVSLGNNNNLVLSDTTCFTFRYSGSAYIYASSAAGQNCGLISPNGLTSANGRAYWMSSHGFHMYTGGVTPIPRHDEIREYVFGLINLTYAYKTTACYNPLNSEAWWYFVGKGETEPGYYVMVNTDTFAWSTGRMARSAASASRDALQRPLLASPSGVLYEHENGIDADGAPLPSSIKTSAVRVGSAEATLDVTGFFPDFERQTGPITIRVSAFDRRPDSKNIIPLETQDMVIEPSDQVIDLHLGARYMVFELISSALGDDWRMGAPQIEYGTSATRR